MTQSLPAPDPVAQAHSRVLTDRLLASVQAAPVPMSMFMQRCLYEPGLGYYMAGAQKFGPAGDFITAPELSPLFGACIARQCTEILNHSGGGVLELGAGSGRLALSVIQAMPKDAWSNYTIIEPSADLQQRQQSLLSDALTPALFAKVQWSETLPTAFTGVILANEVMDALPVERLQRTERGFVVEAVGLHPQSDHLALTTVAASALPDDEIDRLNKALASLEADLGCAWQPGYCSELHLLLRPWIASLADCLSCGALLLIDYGYPRREYYLPERTDGTLQCFYRHHAHNDVTFWPGLQDITAHVDFTTVVEAGDAAGLTLLGYTTQAAFLMGCGLPEIATQTSAIWGGNTTTGNEVGRVQRQQAINRLTLPGEMGERFQVMALGRGVEAALAGFSMLDLSHRL